MKVPKTTMLLSVLIIIFSILVFVGESSDKSDADGGSCGDSMTWSYEGNTLTISGSGSMYTYATSERPWNSFASSVKTLIIGDDVSSISSSAFSGMSGLTSLTIPISLNAVADNSSPAFAGCTNISNVTFTPGSGNGFSYQDSDYSSNYYIYTKTPWYNSKSKITSITFESGIKSIGSYAFRYQTNITALSFPDTVGSLEYRSFSGCSGLKSLTIPISCSVPYSFEDVASITSIALSKGTGVGSDSISNCWYNSRSTITSVTIASGVTSIGSNCFSFLTNVSDIILPSSINKIKESSFIECKRITVESGNASFINDTAGALLDISNSTLYHVPADLTSYSIPSSVNNIAAYAFYGASSISTISIPDTVTSIGSNSFYGMSGLTSLTIPISLNAVADNSSPAFAGCTNISNVTFTPGSGNGFSYQDSDYSSNYYIYTKTPWYNSKSKITSITFESGIKSIGSYAFRYQTNITALSFPDTVGSLEYRSFSDCTGLTSIFLPFSIKSLSGDSFKGITFYDIDGITKLSQGPSLASYQYIGTYSKMVRQPDSDHFTVYFNSNGGTEVPSQSMYKGYTVTKPADPTRTGYTFKEWTLNDSPFDFSTKIYESITLIGTWNINKYTVTFNSNGGSPVAPQSVEYMSTAYKPANPTISGYTFSGWLLSGKEYDFSTPVTSDITLMASWSKEDQYVITFDSDGGSTVPMQTLKTGEKVTKPTDPTKTGYTFKEWQLNGAAYNFNSVVTSNLTLVATWTAKNYTVTFDTDGGSYVPSQTVPYGTKATKPTDPTKTGFTFKEWQLNGATYTFTSNVIGDIKLVAIWVSEGNYVVTFDSNGGSAVASQTVASGSKASKPADPVKEGHSFKGWLLNGTLFDFNTPITSNITLTASWNKETYTVTFDSNGGSYVSSQRVEYGNTVTKPMDPTKLGFDFKEWQYNGKAYSFDSYVKEDMTLIAVWESEGYFVVSFDSAGGSAVPSQSVESGKLATKPDNPYRDGYAFVEWKNKGVTYDFSTPVTQDITLTAFWSAESFKVIFDSNGGSSVESQTVAYGSTVKKPTDPVKEGFNFSEWQLNGQTYSFSTEVKEDLTLTAKWVSEGMWTVTFDSNGGSSISSQLVENGKLAYEPNNPHRQGYTFKGWVQGSTPYDFNSPVYSNVSLIALWSSNTDPSGDSDLVMIVAVAAGAGLLAILGIGVGMNIRGKSNINKIMKRIEKLPYKEPKRY